MKQSSDILQILLLDGTAFGFLCWVLAVLIIAQLIKLAMVPVKLVAVLWRFRWSVILRFSKFGAAMVLASALCCWVFRSQIADKIQYIEQRYLLPAFPNADTSTHALAIYEQELAKRVDAYEFAIVQRRTHEIAAKVGSNPLAIYEVAYSECGLNPFTIRRDGIAAGWIQFTNAGLKGLTISGQPATLQAVKDACQRRDAVLIMDLTEQYLVSRSKGTPMPRAADVYVCVFAPGHLGRPNEKTLYEGWANPAYYLNAGLDGYYTATIDGRQQIFRSSGACDGRITINDLDLCLQAKKSRLLQRYNHTFTSNSSL